MSSPRRDVMSPAGRLLQALTCLAVLLFMHPSASAWEFSLHGFIQGNYTPDIVSPNPDGGDFKWAEERLQLRLDVNKEPFHLLLKTDAWYDHIEREPDIELREGYLDYTASHWDLRLGRQVITWGVGDLLFINDVFPKDFDAFFSGRPLEYLKRGGDGAKIGAYPGFASFELVVIPFFEPNQYPDPQRFWVFDPIPAVTDRQKKEPPVTLGNTEIALRAYRDILGYDASVYYYRGFWRQPSMAPNNWVNPTNLTLFYPKLFVLGASIQGRALDGVMSMEGGYYDSREDRSGTDPGIPNSQTRFLIGYQRQLWEDFTIGVQWYLEYMHDYAEYKENLPAGFPQERKLRQLVTLRLTQLLMHQTLKLSWFSFWSPSQGDYLLNPEIKYNLTDHVWAAVGAMIFGGGETWSQFGQLDKNDNIYVQMRYEF